MRKAIYRAIDFDETDVSGKSDTGHTHTESEITDLDHDAVKLQGVDVQDHAPLDGEYLKYVSANSQWEPASVAGAGNHIPEWMGGFTTPPTTAWSWDNQNTSTITDQTGANKGLYLEETTQTTPEEINVYHRAAPSTPWTLEACFILQGWCNDKHQGGLCMRESATGKIVTMGAHIGTNTMNLIHGKWTTSTSFSANYSVNPFRLSPAFVVWFKFEDDGTNLKYYISNNGYNWVQLNSSTYDKLRGDFFTTGPDQIGIYIYPDNTLTQKAGVVLLSWKTA